MINSNNVLQNKIFLWFQWYDAKHFKNYVHNYIFSFGLQTVFAKGAGHSLTEQAALGYEVISLDWTVDPEEARKQVGPNITLQGNLDPQDLYKTPEEVRELATAMVRKFGKTRYIANLGHGITPQTPIVSMEVLVDAAHKAL